LSDGSAKVRHVTDRPGIGRGPVRSRLAERAELAVKNRRVFPYLAAVTAIIAVTTGIIAHLIDKKDFPTVGIGIWWSIVTLGTVGYGDVVPHTAWGRVLGSVVIIFGVTFISFLIAIVTSLFVDANREEIESERTAKQVQALELLHSIDDRLAALEARLGPTSGPSP
jgi:voltage-gated potassium channel